jgi:hypothetical protein
MIFEEDQLNDRKENSGFILPLFSTLEGVFIHVKRNKYNYEKYPDS